jgi:hypothetical protein
MMYCDGCFLFLILPVFIGILRHGFYRHRFVFSFQKPDEICRAIIHGNADRVETERNGDKGRNNYQKEEN